MIKFGEDKSPTTLVLEISRIKMDLKENVKDFNQRFLTLLNKILVALRPIDVVLIELYTTSFPITHAFFVKKVGKKTLRETFDEEIKVDKELMTLIGSLGSEEKKYQPPRK